MSTHPHVIKTPPRTTAIAWTVAVLAHGNNQMGGGS
jgi:hypothetical protein